jgi:hypothetical protein
VKSAETPCIAVGFLGYTGSGKSSLVNALVDEEMLVPCNAMRASTSVVAEIACNKSEDPAEAYAAKIEFIFKAEWPAEFRVLPDDIRSRPVGEPINTQRGILILVSPLARSAQCIQAS